MPPPTSMPLRKAVFARMQEEATATEIAEALRMSVRTVEKLLTRFRQGGEAALAPTPAVPPPRRSCGPGVAEAAVALRRKEPTWSSAVVMLQLAVRRPGRRPPSDRTVRRWLAKAGVPRSPSHGAWRAPMLNGLMELACRDRLPEQP